MDRPSARFPLPLLMLVLLSGCLGSEAAGPGDAGAVDAGGSDGQDGDSGTPSPADPAGFAVLLSQDFQIDSVQGGEPIVVTVPDGVRGVFLALDYRDGAYDGASFTLGQCKDVAETSGTAVSANAVTFGLGGSTNAGVLHECGPLPAGAHEVTWRISQGVLTGHLTVYGDGA